MTEASRSKDSSVILRNNNSLILPFAVNVKRLYTEGKAYAWERPDCCPKCKGSRLWGHGFVPRFFEGIDDTYLWLKRWRCPDCNAVHTARPACFFSRFRYTVMTILACLYAKLERGRWARCLPRQNQQYWYVGLLRQASRFSNTAAPTLQTISELLRITVVPVTHCNSS